MSMNVVAVAFSELYNQKPRPKDWMEPEMRVHFQGQSLQGKVHAIQNTHCYALKHFGHMPVVFDARHVLYVTLISGSTLE